MGMIPLFFNLHLIIGAAGYLSGFRLPGENTTKVHEKQAAGGLRIRRDLVQRPYQGEIGLIFFCIIH